MTKRSEPARRARARPKQPAAPGPTIVKRPWVVPASLAQNASDNAQAGPPPAPPATLEAATTAYDFVPESEEDMARMRLERD